MEISRSKVFSLYLMPEVYILEVSRVPAVEDRFP